MAAVTMTAAWSLPLAGPALAQYTTPPPGGGLPTDTQTQPVAEAGGSMGNQLQQIQSAGGQGLPVTGGDVVGMAAMGAGAVMVGGVLVALRRRSALA